MTFTRLSAIVNPTNVPWWIQHPWNTTNTYLYSERLTPTSYYYIDPTTTRSNFSKDSCPPPDPSSHYHDRSSKLYGTRCRRTSARCHGPEARKVAEGGGSRLSGPMGARGGEGGGSR